MTDRPPYPEGYVVGPCVCGSWPGGRCLKCPWIPAPAQPDPLHVANERGEGWQPIETAPKDGTWLLLAGSTYKTGAGILVARWDAEDWESADDGYPAYVKPTHWMPLPAAPKEKP